MSQLDTAHARAWASTGKMRRKVALFGHFGCANFGNEATLQAILHHLRRFQPDAEITCICTEPERAAATHHIKAIPLAETFFQSWVPRTPTARVVRRICGVPTEPYRWVKSFMRLRRTDVLIIAGTGLLTDAYGLFGWGPYNVFKWSLIARICRCQLLFVSVGAGPIHGAIGRFFVRLALSMADFRSYRDDATKRYLESVGVHADGDPVHPDLTFSLPEIVIPAQSATQKSRTVVGLGLMDFAGMYSAPRLSREIYLAYLVQLSSAVRWLLARGYDVRFLVGDLGDTRVKEALKGLVRAESSEHHEGNLIDEPVVSVEDLLSQIAATDMVMATRFHSALLALLCNKPVIAISFHQKSESLMSAMGLSEYCVDINDLRADRLIETFCDLERNAGKLKPLIGQKAREYREALDEQYELIFQEATWKKR